MGIFMFLDQSCAKIRLNSRESKSTSHESKSTSHENTSTSHESKSTSHESKSTSHESNLKQNWIIIFCGSQLSVESNFAIAL